MNSILLIWITDFMSVERFEFQCHRFLMKILLLFLVQQNYSRIWYYALLRLSIFECFKTFIYAFSMFFLELFFSKQFFPFFFQKNQFDSIFSNVFFLQNLNHHSKSTNDFIQCRIQNSWRKISCWSLKLYTCRIPVTKQT